MKNRIAFLPLAALAWCALLAGGAQAQVFTPSLLSPRQESDMGIYLADGFSTSDGLAVEGIWRRGYGAYDLGLRGGIGDTDEGAVLLLGGDYRRPLRLDTAPVEIAATGGAQLALGDGAGLGFGAGLSVGGTFTPEEFTVTPYLHPRLALVETLRGDGLDLEILADAGVDFRFRPDLTARLALGFGGPTSDFALGLAWR